MREIASSCRPPDPVEPDPSRDGFSASNVPEDPCRAKEASGLASAATLPLTVVIPLYNEEPVVTLLVERLAETSRKNPRYEFVFVDDGSSDATASRLTEELRGPRWGGAPATVIRLRRNFGQTAAMLAGMEAARTPLTATMDGDLQNDPDDIGKLAAKLEEGYDVVCGWRRDRKDPPARVMVSRVANAAIRCLAGLPVHDNGCSLRVYRTEVLGHLAIYGEQHRLIPALLQNQGFRITEMVVGHHPRTRGTSKYGFERIVKVLLDLMVLKFFQSYATKPIYVFGGMGLLMMALSVPALGYALFLKVWEGVSLIQTPLPVLAAFMAFGGIICLLLGLIAEVLMRTYYEAQDKRSYVVLGVDVIHAPGEQASSDAHTRDEA